MSIINQPTQDQTKPPACLACGYQPATSQHRRDDRPMFPIIDEHGSHKLCGLCTIRVLARCGSDGVALLLTGSLSIAAVTR